MTRAGDTGRSGAALGEAGGDAVPNRFVMGVPSRLMAGVCFMLCLTSQ